MTKPCILCVAITGSVPQKADNPAVPITLAEQVESTHAAFEAGASIVHAHVREDDGTPTSDPERFARLKEGIERHCPGMIVQLSTGGRSGAGRARGGMLPLRPDMASLSAGSNNFPTRVYENPPDLVDWLAAEMLAHDVKPEVECFDLSHIHQAARMQGDGRLAAPAYVQFVMGVRNAMPADRETFDFYVATVERLLPGSEWCAAGIGAAQVTLNEWAVAAGGHARTGLEDNVRLDRDTLAPSNAALVERGGGDLRAPRAAGGDVAAGAGDARAARGVGGVSGDAGTDADRPPYGAPAIRTIAMPADTNPAGDIFGGWLMSQMDLGAGSVAIRTSRGRCATVSVDRFQFHRPVRVGDEVSIYATLVRSGRSSMTIEVEAWRRARDEERSERVTRATFVFVALDADGQPRSITAPGPAAAKR